MSDQEPTRVTRRDLLTGRIFTSNTIKEDNNNIDKQVADGDHYLNRRDFLRLFALSLAASATSCMRLPRIIEDETLLPDQLELTTEELDRTELDNARERLDSLLSEYPNLFDPIVERSELINFLPASVSGNIAVVGAYLTPLLHKEILDELAVGENQTLSTLTGIGIELNTPEFIPGMWPLEPLALNEQKPEEVNGQLPVDILTELLNRYPVPSNVVSTENYAGSHYDSRESEIGYHKDQVNTLIDMAKLEGNMDLSEDSERLAKDVQLFVLLHEMVHSLDILANPHLFKYLTNEQISKLFELRLKIVNPTDIANELFKFPYTQTTNISQTSDRPFIVLSTNQQDKMQMSQKIYAMQSYASALGQKPLDISPKVFDLLSIFIETPANNLRDWIIQSINDQTIDLDSLTPEGLATLFIEGDGGAGEVVQQALQDEELLKAVKNKISVLYNQSKINNERINSDWTNEDLGESKGSEELLSTGLELLAGRLRKIDINSLDKETLSDVFAEAVGYSIITNKLDMGMIPQNILIDFFWWGRKIFTEQLADVGATGLYLEIKSTQQDDVNVTAESSMEYLRAVFNYLDPKVVENIWMSKVDVM